MYVVTKHAAPPPEEAQHVVWQHGMGTQQLRESTESRNFRDVIPDLEQIIENNTIYRQVMAEKKVGRPGHYYGRDIVIEGAVPAALHIAAAAEYDGDPEWYRDDKKFQDFMRRHPEYSWTNG